MVWVPDPLKNQDVTVISSATTTYSHRPVGDKAPLISVAQGIMGEHGSVDG
ncbi:unnamed protein product [Dovyalis caffra]|uniref:Uncharacterized protein n=1 Tax=Dovyalis caffra TaxID=77055 RepID=A0AAV1SJX6_9ROSI|nr:unnamed protein product [Dovyalis caffra]